MNGDLAPNNLGPFLEYESVFSLFRKVCFVLVLNRILICCIDPNKHIFFLYKCIFDVYLLSSVELNILFIKYKSIHKVFFQKVEVPRKHTSIINNRQNDA